MLPELRTVAIGGGAVIGLYEYGDASGKPVVALHGVPSCGAGFRLAHEPALTLGVRVLAPDRPGVGLSSPDVGWTIGSYPAVLAALADRLGIGRFGVWGYSGSAPYALATAQALADRVTAVAVAAGMGQIGEWAEAADFGTTDRLFLTLARKRPRLATPMLGAIARLARLSPRTAVKGFSKELSESDRSVLTRFKTPAEAMALFTQAFLKGARGAVGDYAAIGGAWGVDFSSIAVPVKILHGDADTMVPLRHSLELAKRISDAQFQVWPGEGHLAPLTHAGEILDWLASRDI